MNLVRVHSSLLRKMDNNISIGVNFNGETTYKGEKLIYPAADRNKQPILDILKNVFSSAPGHKLCLEISSGSGQHLSHFAPHFPHIEFQPSEYDRDLFGSISIYASGCVTSNMKPPIFIDITRNLSKYGFEAATIDYIYNANMMHISPYACTIGLFHNAGMYLKTDGLLITYGPFAQDGVITPQSNVDFQMYLKSRSSSWGIRDIKDLKKLAEENNMILVKIFDMPANNKCLMWKKTLTNIQ